ncbi:MAG: DUF4136 domain-containing protein [Planctomycetes bacterium]|nr:DUF4136 domain-containing protein [Planctomycetota bacterium]
MRDWGPVRLRRGRSYAWIDPPHETINPKVQGNTLLAERIERAVDPVLHQRGLREVIPDAAQLLVTHHIGIDERYDVSTTSYGLGFGFGGRGFGGWGYGTYGWGGPTFSDSVVRRVDEATLILDLIDPRTNRLVWRGLGRLELAPRGTPDERERQVRETVEAILAQFPPGHGSE